MDQAVSRQAAAVRNHEAIGARALNPGMAQVGPAMQPLASLAAAVPPYPDPLDQLVGGLFAQRIIPMQDGIDGADVIMEVVRPEPRDPLDQVLLEGRRWARDGEPAPRHMDQGEEMLILVRRGH